MKLNLGCGAHAMEDWVNYDIEWAPGSSVIKFDLSKWGLPHVDNSVDYIFSEHFIEHITREQCENLVRDCFRVLRPGGVIRLATPSLSKLLSNYIEGSRMGMEDLDLPQVWNPKTPCQMVNEGMRLWGHSFLYDAQELCSLLQGVGFHSTELVSWRKSSYPELQELEVRPYHGDLIMEAIKPQA